MSIITDALKKAEQDRELKTKSQVSETSVQTAPIAEPEQDELSAQILSESVLAQNLQVETEKPESPESIETLQAPPQRKYAWIFSVSVVSLFILAFLIFPKKSTIMTTSGASAPAGQFFPKSQGAFNLSGITKLDKDFYAIINGEIVQVGDSIGGATVKEIMDREVILKTRSGEVKLIIVS